MSDIEIVWKHRAVRYLAARLHAVGLEGDQAIATAAAEIETVWPDHAEYVSPESAASAAYEALCDDADRSGI